MLARGSAKQHSFLDFINEDYLLVLAELVEEHLSKYSASMSGIFHRRDHNQAEAKLREIHESVAKKIELTNLEKVSIEILSKLNSIINSEENNDQELDDMTSTINATFDAKLFDHTESEKIDELKQLLHVSIRSIQEASTDQQIQHCLQDINVNILKLKKSRHSELTALHKSLLGSLNTFLNEKHAGNEHIEHLKNLLVAVLKQYSENVYPHDTYDHSHINGALLNLDMTGMYLSKEDHDFSMKWALFDGNADCASNPEQYSSWKTFLTLVQNDWDEPHYTAKLTTAVEDLLGIPSHREYRLDSDLRSQLNKADIRLSQRYIAPPVERFRTLTRNEVSQLVDSDHQNLKPLAHELQQLQRMHQQIIIWTNRNLEIVFTEKAIQALIRQLEHPDNNTTPDNILTDIANGYKKILAEVHKVQLHLTTEYHFIKDEIEIKKLAVSKLPYNAHPFIPTYGQITIAEKKLDRETQEEKLTGRQFHKIKQSQDFNDELKIKHREFEELLKSTLGHFSDAAQIRAFAHELPSHYNGGDSSGYRFSSAEIDEQISQLSEEEVEDKYLAETVSALPAINWQHQKQLLERAALGSADKEEQEDFSNKSSSEDEADSSDHEDTALLITRPRESLSEDLRYAEQVREGLHQPQQSFWERHPIARKVLIGLAIGFGLALLGASVATAIIFSGGTVAGAAAGAGSGIGLAAKLGIGGIVAVYTSITTACLSLGASIGAWWAGRSQSEPANPPRHATNEHEYASDDDYDIPVRLSLNSSASRITAALDKPERAHKANSTGNIAVTESSEKSAIPVRSSSSGSLTQFALHADNRRSTTQPNTGAVDQGWNIERPGI